MAVAGVLAFRALRLRGIDLEFDQHRAGDDDVARAAAIKLWNTAIQTGDSPDVVGAAVVTAATAKAPRLRYPASKTARRLRVTRRFVPAAAFDRSLRKQMGLPV